MPSLSTPESPATDTNRDDEPAAQSLVSRLEGRRVLRKAIMATAVMFVVLVVGAEVTLRAWGDRLQTPLLWYHEAAQVKEAQMGDVGDVDVVFVGTSMVWRGIDPEALVGAVPEFDTGYNAGLPAASPVIASRWLLEEVDPQVDPEFVVWGVSTLVFNASWANDSIEGYAGARATREGIFADLDRAFYERFEVVRFRELIRNPVEIYRAVDGRYPDPRSRFTIYPRHLTEYGFRDVVPGQPSRQVGVARAALANYRIDEEALEEIRRAAAELEARDIGLAIVNMPVPDQYIAQHPDGEADYDEAVAVFESLAAELGVDFHDFGRAMPDEAFWDLTHLTPDAAPGFSVMLGDALAVS